MKRRLLSLLLTLLMVFSVIPFAAVNIAAASMGPAPLTKPAISPVWKGGTTYTGYYDGEVSNSSSLKIQWADVSADYYNVAVKALDGEPNPGSDEVGTFLFDFTSNYTKTYISLTKADISSAAGLWIKVFVQSCYSDGTYYSCHYYFKVKASATLSAPSISVQTVSSSSLKISWNKVAGATEYDIYRSTKTTSSSFKLVKTTTSTSWTDTGLDAGTKYYYKVKACNSSTESGFSNRGYATTDEESGAKFDQKPTLSLNIWGNSLDDDVYGPYCPGDTIYFTFTANYSDHVFVQTSNSQLSFVNASGNRANMGTFVEVDSESTATNKTYTNGSSYQIDIDVPEGLPAGDYTITVTATDGVYDPDLEGSIAGTSYYSPVKKSVTVRVIEKSSGGSGGAESMVNTALSLVGKKKSDLGISGEWCAKFVAYCAEKAGCSGENQPFIPRKTTSINVTSAATGQTHKIDTCIQASPISLLNSGSGLVYYFYSSYICNGAEWRGTVTKETFEYYMTGFDTIYDGSRSSCTPMPGDILFFKRSSGEAWAHVGIVVDYNKSTTMITFVDGNNSGNGTWIAGREASTGESGSNAYNKANYLYVNKLKVRLSNERIMAIARPYYDSVTPATATITYDANGGSGAPASTVGKLNDTVTLSSTVPTRTGYTFKGWSKDSNATAASYAAGASYKLTGNVTLYAVWEQEQAVKYTISGTITSATRTDNNVTVLLCDEANKTLSKVVTSSGKYSFEAPNGTYYIKVSKVNHVERDYAVTVKNANVTQNVKICLLGDVTGDGKVNSGDVSRLRSHVSKKKLLTGYELLCADVTGDGKVNSGDVSRLRSHVSKKKPLW